MLTRRATWAAAAIPLLLAGRSSADAPTLNKDLSPLGRLIGKWRGEGDGEPGHSIVERSYEAVPGGNFVISHNRSSYAPQPKNPKGEIHTDVGWFSFDRAAKAVMLRQFHPTESFVNTYSAARDTLAGEVWAFTTVAIENIPAGYRARETYTFAGPDAFEELFEIAEPGKAFGTYSLNRLRRA
jgi:hypothetical protein